MCNSTHTGISRAHSESSYPHTVVNHDELPAAHAGLYLAVSSGPVWFHTVVETASLVANREIAHFAAQGAGGLWQKYAESCQEEHKPAETDPHDEVVKHQHAPQLSERHPVVRHDPEMVVGPANVIRPQLCNLWSGQHAAGPPHNFFHPVVIPKRHLVVLHALPKPSCLFSCIGSK